MTSAAPDLLSVEQAQARLPLVRAISVELQERIDELSRLVGKEEPQPRERALELRRCVRACLQELEGLGVEVERFRPLTLTMTTLDGHGEEVTLSWQYDAPAAQLSA